MEPNRRLTNTGISQHITADRQKRIYQIFETEIRAAEAAHEHYWIASLSYKVTPPLIEERSFDVENLRIPPVVGCYICEEPWTKTARKFCNGDPSGRSCIGKS